MSKDVAAPIDFDSDEKSEGLFSFKTLGKYRKAFSEEVAKSKPSDVSTFLVTFFFIRLLLHAINGLEIPTKQRALFLLILMMCLTSLAGNNKTLQRNLLIEKNVFFFRNSKRYF